MKANKEIKAVMFVAFRDISEHIREKASSPIGFENDVWQSTPRKMNNKETRRLNKLLGISNVNYYNNKNNNNNNHTQQK
tara:strand:+ start:311 stop:547 length:237 start_codon:yes stop_codon:yes gene_type:complete